MMKQILTKLAEHATPLVERVTTSLPSAKKTGTVIGGTYGLCEGLENYIDQLSDHNERRINQDGRRVKKPKKSTILVPTVEYAILGFFGAALLTKSGPPVIGSKPAPKIKL